MSTPGTASRAALIVNVGSRRGRDEARRARQLLRSHGVPLGVCYGLRDPSRLPQVVHAALKDGYTLIILGGGDGSVSSVVGALADGGAVLGLLPLGTANDFARGVGIPQDLDLACAVIAHGRVRRVDLGVVGENRYVNVATIGLGAEVARSVSSRQKRWLGPLAYPLATVRALLRMRTFAATLTFPGSDQPPATFRKVVQIAVGNGRYYGGGSVMAPKAEPDDGRLDVYVIEARSWRTLLGVAWLFKSGEQVRRDDVPYWRTAAVHIATQPRVAMNVDGELTRQNITDFSVARGALQVLVPAD